MQKGDNLIVVSVRKILTSNASSVAVPPWAVNVESHLIASLQTSSVGSLIRSCQEIVELEKAIKLNLHNVINRVSLVPCSRCVVHPGLTSPEWDAQGAYLVFCKKILLHKFSWLYEGVIRKLITYEMFSPFNCSHTNDVSSFVNSSIKSTIDPDVSIRMTTCENAASGWERK